MNYIILVNKDHPIDRNYQLNSLVKVNSKVTEHLDSNHAIYLEKSALKAWLCLKKEALLSGMNLEIESGYRTVEYQQAILDYYIKKEGIQLALSRVALPSTSEHHTGLALDYGFFKGKEFVEVTEDDDEYKFVLLNAHKHGFILRYPKGKENITGYRFEPWHLRYVGEQVAEKIFTKKITLEEYHLDNNK